MLLGCVPDRPHPGARYTPHVVHGEITELHLLSSPAAVRVDTAGKMAGFAGQIYASNPRIAGALVIEEGSLEVLLFDGLLSNVPIETLKPAQVWTFSAAELKRLERGTSIGASYSLSLVWSELKLIQDRVTAVARYTNRRGIKIYSAPAVIFLNAR